MGVSDHVCRNWSGWRSLTHGSGFPRKMDVFGKVFAACDVVMGHLALQNGRTT